jgi:hypothetical protein
VFVGEYSCDIIQGKDLVLCKKSDSIMRYSGGNTPRDTFLAPKDYCGYIPLMNTGKKKECNCSSLKIVLNGKVRVLLLTNRKIHEG